MTTPETPENHKAPETNQEAEQKGKNAKNTKNKKKENLTWKRKNAVKNFLGAVYDNKIPGLSTNKPFVANLNNEVERKMFHDYILLTEPTLIGNAVPQDTSIPNTTTQTDSTQPNVWKEIFDMIEANSDHYAVRIRLERETLWRKVQNEYDFSEDQGKLMKKKVDTLSYTEIQTYLSKKKEFHEWIRREALADSRKSLQALSKFQSQLHALSPEKQEKLARMLEHFSTRPTHEDIRLFLGFIKDCDAPTAKLLVQEILPTISLTDALSNNLINSDNFQKIVWENIGDVLQTKYGNQNSKAFSDFLIQFRKDHGKNLHISIEDVIKHNNNNPATVVDTLLRSSAFIGAIQKDIHDDIEEAVNKKTLPHEKLGRGFPQRNDKWELSPDVISVFSKNFDVRATNLNLFFRAFGGQEDIYLCGKLNKEDVIFHITNILPKDGVEQKEVNTLSIEMLVRDDSSGNFHVPNGTGAEAYRMENFYDIVSGLETPVFMKKEAIQERLKTDHNSLLVEEDENISSIDSLKNALDNIDPNGAQHGFDVGTTFFGKADGINYQAFIVTAINGDGSFQISNGTTNNIQTFGGLDNMSLSSFVKIFRKGAFGRIPALNTPQNFLNAVVTTFTKNTDKFSRLKFEESGNKMGFLSNDAEVKDKSNPPFITEFLSGDSKTALVLENMSTTGADVIIHEDVSKDDKTKERKSKRVTRTHFDWPMIYTFLHEEKAIPNFESVDAEASKIVQEESKMHEHAGVFGRLMQWYSVADLLSGGKKTIDFIKHKLEHSSKTHAAKATLMFGGLLGMGIWNEHWYDSLRTDVQNDQKKMMEETLEHLNKMNPPKFRQKHIEHILSSKGSPQYEYIAAALSMVEKHGTLYTGEMSKHEGSYVFFKRIFGIPLDADVTKTKIFQDALAQLSSGGFLIREEALIFVALRIAWGDKLINPAYWNMVKQTWKKGMDGELENGKNEAASMDSLDAKISHVEYKLKSKEYASGIGALEPILSQWGPAWAMHFLPMLLVMSDIPSKLREENFKKLFLTPFGGQPLPGLWFIKNPTQQALFRRVFERLIKESGNAAMADAYKKTNKYSRWDAKFIEEFAAFWKEYGDELAPKLCCTPDSPDIFLKKDDPEYGDYKAYFDSYSGIFKDPNFKINDDAEQNGHYKNDHSSFFLLSPKAYLNRVNPGGGHGVIEKAEEIARFEEIMNAVRSVRLLKWGNREKQKELFRVYHRAIMDKFMRVNEDVYKKYEAKKAPDHIEKLRSTGISFPKSWKLFGSTDAYLESGTYEHHLTQDFERFMQNVTYTPEVNTDSEIARMATKARIQDVMTRLTQANDSSFKKAA